MGGMETIQGTSAMRPAEFGSRPLPIPVCIAAALALITLAMLAGCAGHSAFDKSELAFTRVFTPQVPEFLSGPAGALLTNAGGFSARATFESFPPQALKGVETMEGELLGNGTRLLFAPRTSDAAARKDFELGGFSFIWDVAAGSGFVLSEALQGYAPVSSSVKPAKVTLQSGTQNAVVTLDNGSAWLFEVTRSSPAVLPTRISSVTNAPPFILKIARIRSEAPPANLFAPPEGFVKYRSPEALADELAARKNNVRRRGI